MTIQAYEAIMVWNLKMGAITSAGAHINKISPHVTKGFRRTRKRKMSPFPKANPDSSDCTCFKVIYQVQTIALSKLIWANSYETPLLELVSILNCDREEFFYLASPNPNT